MIKELRVPLFDLISSIAEAVDLISPVIANHHKRVAYIAASIGQEMGLSDTDQNNLILAGLLHDCGALTIKERLETLSFEIEHPYHHAALGFRLLKRFKPLEDIAKIVLFHHLPWNRANSIGAVPFTSQILHLADRIDVLIDKKRNILDQVNEIKLKIGEHQGEMFAPEAVSGFFQLSRLEYFWFDLFSESIQTVLANRASLTSIELNLTRLAEVAGLFAQLVDFRNRFTATHSSGVAVVAESIGKLGGLSEREYGLLKIAGYLHDLGKLVVPEFILEKPGRLLEGELYTIKSHPYYTYRLLEKIPCMEIINIWASYHHERLDGNGYPFHRQADNLSFGSRIVAVADIFTALAENRPYRKGMSPLDTEKLLREMAKQSALDVNIVELLLTNQNRINQARICAQEMAEKDYEIFMSFNNDVSEAPEWLLQKELA